jgi:hypothetical protein
VIGAVVVAAVVMAPVVLAVVALAVVGSVADVAGGVIGSVLREGGRGGGAQAERGDGQGDGDRTAGHGVYLLRLLGVSLPRIGSGSH